jgi:hypothetical protein
MDSVANLPVDLQLAGRLARRGLWTLMPAICLGYGWKIGVYSANLRNGSAGEMPGSVSELMVT